MSVWIVKGFIEGYSGVGDKEVRRVSVIYQGAAEPRTLIHRKGDWTLYGASIFLVMPAWAGWAVECRRVTLSVAER